MLKDWSFHNEREAECFEREDAMSLSDIEKLDVNEALTDLERIEQLLKNGLEKQQISVLAALPGTICNHYSENNLVLVLDCLKFAWHKHERNASPIIYNHIYKALGDLAKSTVDGRILPISLASFDEGYDEVVRTYQQETKHTKFLLPADHVTKYLLPLLLELSTETELKEHAEAASLAFVSVMPRIESLPYKVRILRFAVEKGDVSQPAGSRLICCFILGAIAGFGIFPETDLRGTYFGKMMALCQDTDTDVRKCMCIQLDSLARVISDDNASSELLTELVELLQDEEEGVKQAAFLAILSLLDKFPTTKRMQTIIPLILDIIDKQPDHLRFLLAENYGAMVVKLEALKHISSNDVATNDISGPVLHGYIKLCQSGDASLRVSCAYNFPAIVKCLSISYHTTILDNLLPKFAEDPDENVRICLAAGIHEVATIIGPGRTASHINPNLLRELSDTSSKVQGLAISRTPIIVAQYCNCDSFGEESKVRLVDATVKAILQQHSCLSQSQNFEQINIIHAMRVITAWCSSAQVYDLLVPLLFDFFEVGARPVQLESMRALVYIIRRLDANHYRYTLLSRLRNDYGRGRSYWRRILYLEGCLLALKVNSRQYCRYNFLDIAIELMEDPIANVRMKAISLLPCWYQVLSVLGEERLLEKLRQYINEIIIDDDRDVMQAILDARKVLAFERSTERSTYTESENLEESRRLKEEDQLGMVADHEDANDARWISLLDCSIMIGKDGQVIRRAREKAIDSYMHKNSNKAAGKDGPRAIGASNTLGLATLTANHVGSASISGTTISPLLLSSNGVLGTTRQDSGRAKLLSKANYNKGSSTAPVTTLPNCASARLPSTLKKTHTAKVSNSSKSLTLSGSSSKNIRPPNVIAIKDTTVITRIPIIRSITGKRENSPLTSVKPVLLVGNTTSNSANAVGTHSVGYNGNSDLLATAASKKCPESATGIAGQGKPKVGPSKR